MINTQVLIIGGGFAGVGAAQDLAKNGVRATLVDQKDYFEVTFANLRNLTDPTKTQNRARKYYRDFLNSDFIQAKVHTLSETQAQLENGEIIQFERAIIASGTAYPSMSVAKTHQAFSLAERNQEFMAWHEKLQTASSVLVIGGGVVGVELAGEIAYTFPDKAISLSHSGKALLPGYKKKAQQKAQQQLKAQGVSVLLQHKFQKQGEAYVDQNSGKKSSADLVFEAVGAKPNNDFLQAHLADCLTQSGYIKVDANFAVKGHKNLYALGDIADVGEAKLGYLAKMQGFHLAKNIAAQLKGKRVKPYQTKPLIALIPTGQTSGIMHLPFAVTSASFLVNLKQKDLFVNKVYKAFGTQPNAQ